MKMKVNHLGRIDNIDNVSQIIHNTTKDRLLIVEEEDKGYQIHGYISSEIADIEVTFPEYDNEETFTSNPHTSGK